MASLSPTDDDEVYEARLAEQRREMERAEQASAARVAARVDVLRKEKPGPINLSRMGAKTVGDMFLLDVGCEVWEHQDPTADYDRRGGLVVEITDDNEFTKDGEIIRHRAFKCFYWYWTPFTPQAWCILTEDQVDLAACQGPQLAHIRSAYRKLCKAVGDCRGTAHARELEFVSIAARLAGVIGQRWS